MKDRLTQEGEEIPFYQYDMDVGFSNGTDRLFLVWPTIISHEIDEHSPLYTLSEEDLKAQRLEIIGMQYLIDNRYCSLAGIKQLSLYNSLTF